MLQRLRAAAASGMDPDEEWWTEYNDDVNELERAVDMWRLGPDINHVLSIGLPVDASEFLWTEGAESIQIGDAAWITYLSPQRLRTVVSMLEPLDQDTIDHRILSGSGARVSREEVVERVLEVLEMLRWASACGRGILRDFSA